MLTFWGVTPSRWIKKHCFQGQEDFPLPEQLSLLIQHSVISLSRFTFTLTILAYPSIVWPWNSTFFMLLLFFLCELGTGSQSMMSWTEEGLEPLCLDGIRSVVNVPCQSHPFPPVRSTSSTSTAKNEGWCPNSIDITCAMFIIGENEMSACWIIL